MLDNQRIRAVFRKAGYRVAGEVVTPVPDRFEMMETVSKVLENPSARAIEAIVLCVLKLVEEGSIIQFPKQTNQSARRLGLILSELQNYIRLSSEQKHRLGEWLLTHVQAYGNVQGEWIGLSANLRLSRFRILSENEKYWRVYGQVGVREDFYVKRKEASGDS